MRKILIAYGALVLLVLILAFAKFRGFEFFNFGSNATASINNQTYKVTLAKDDKSRQIGLSNRDSLPANEGMLFIFENKGRYSFWMKDTKIPLDIIFINDDKIVHIVKNAPPQADKTGNLPIYTPNTDVNYVLEINGGEAEKHQFKNGDTVTLAGIE